MPHPCLPLVPEGATQINSILSVVRGERDWVYFCGVHPVFQHPADDLRSFRMVTAQFCAQGSCTQAEVVRAFGIPKLTVLRSVQKYGEEGIAGFFQPRRGGGPSVLTAEVVVRVQALLDQGLSRGEVGKELGIDYDTIRKAIRAGRLREPARSAARREASQGLAAVSDKSSRSEADAAAGEGMGIACTRPIERVLAAFGQLEGGASTQFTPSRDVSSGGALCALPALAENGLFRHLDALPVLSGYYMTLHIILLLAHMALCRIKAVEQLQFETPGELGKHLGLDRIPEVRCLRQKLATLSQDGAPERWAGVLSQEWMERDPELAGTLYVDGHVRLYHGQQTKLPRRYVSRHRLCLRGTTDYWVNDALGQPFFSVERPIDHGMLEALRSDVVPRLLKEVPGQPTEEQLKADPHRSRFLIIFDREGYSPVFFREMWREHRIACVTYHKHPKEDWPESLFIETQVLMPRGETVSLRLAEMGTWMGSRKEGLWVREVRKLNPDGHQTSMISTAFGLEGPATAGALMSRWSQENFFRYMMEHFEIDALNEYKTEAIPDTNRPVVNPAWRDLDRQSRSIRAKLTKAQARFAAMTLHPEAEGHQIQSWEQKKTELQEVIERLEHTLEALKERVKATPRHLAWKDLPEQDKFRRLAPSRKRLTDTVKLVAYRAETAMVNIVREKFAHEDEARALVRELFQSDADLYPNESESLLEVRLHGMANPRSNGAIQHLLDHLNAAEFTYPGTKLRLVYTLPGPLKKGPA